MNTTSPRFLFLVHCPPLPVLRMQETLDRILTVAAYDLYVSVIFLDDGVYHVVKAGTAREHAGPSWLASLRTLELCEISQVLVDRTSLSDRGFGEHDVAIAAEVVDCDRVRSCLAEHNRLFLC